MVSWILALGLVGTAWGMASPESAPDRSTSRVGMGVYGQLDPARVRAGFDVSGTAPTPTPGVRVGMDFEHRSWWMPDDVLYDYWFEGDSSVFVPGWWNGWLRLHLFGRRTWGEGRLVPGVDLGISVVRDRYVSPEAQATLMEDHGMLTAPLWWASAGPELHLGWIDPCDRSMVAATARYHHPFYARGGDLYHEYASSIGHDPWELAPKRLVAGVVARFQVSFIYVEMEAARRLGFPGPAAVDLAGAESTATWIVDLAGGLGF